MINRRARHNYHIIEKLEAGIVLSGFEVKSAKMGRVDLNEGFARIENGELQLKNVYIHPFQNPPQGYNPRESRKLLLHKAELHRLTGKISQSGLNLIPLSLYTRRNLIKVELGLAASKKKYDKRRAIKERDEARKTEQELSYRG